ADEQLGDKRAARHLNQMPHRTGDPFKCSLRLQPQTTRQSLAQAPQRGGIHLHDKIRITGRPGYGVEIRHELADNYVTNAGGFESLDDSHDGVVRGHRRSSSRMRSSLARRSAWTPASSICGWWWRMPSTISWHARWNRRGPSSSLSAGDIARARATSSR